MPYNFDWRFPSDAQGPTSQPEKSPAQTPPVRSGFRYAQLVDPVAHAPGHHLCTVYFRKNDTTFCLQMIEGRLRNEVIFRGISRSRGQPSNMQLFTLSGPLIDQLNLLAEGVELAGGPAFPSVTLHRFRRQNESEAESTLPDIEFHIYPLPIRSVDGRNPDSLLLTPTGEGHDISEIAVIGLSEGWIGWAIAAGALIGVIAVVAYAVSRGASVSASGGVSSPAGSASGNLNISQGASGPRDAGSDDGSPPPTGP
ncbi:hypothetical protein LMG28614_06005 [Paraburkholderia ultramafica]|uniref:Uncharacterized protein n=1 Tax=Paraburkholderia ultramafica TaxID=1544867 RepID=A0A6S7D2F7_9BURK|nr:hypothetical protein [Paraburkholderia ultramafica]CAB3804304.1 hypothetical protein LMG28614_06005 [Paraburkholderia ultramafica]